MHDADYWIEQLNLKPHPEGGYYSSTFKSGNFIDKYPRSPKTVRRCSTLIHFLLKKGQCSHFHRLKSDEIWLIQQGGPLTLWLIDEQGKLREERLGCRPENNEQLQVFIPANTWFAAELHKETDFTLMSCLVTPGFEWEDFELGTKEPLLQAFPQHKQLINKLCLD